MSKDVRAKVELIYVGEGGLPQVTFFGAITPNDIRFSKLAIQRSFAAYIIQQGRKEEDKRQARLKQEEEDKKKLEAVNKKLEEAIKEKKNEPRPVK